MPTSKGDIIEGRHVTMPGVSARTKNTNKGGNLLPSLILYI